MSHLDGPLVKARIAASFEDIDLIDRLAAAWLRHAGLKGEELGHLALGVREAVANAVTHGSALDPEKSVEVVFERRNNVAHIRVKDSGGGFDLEGLPDPLAPENLLRPSGRGILLMRAYADEVEFSFADGTLVELRKALPETGTDEEE